MKIKYTADAFASLTGLINFIETNNTVGDGIRWLNHYEEFLRKAFRNPQKKKICNNKTFKRIELHCVYFNDWLIAFSIDENFVLIEAILHKSRISD